MKNENCQNLIFLKNRIVETFNNRQLNPRPILLVGSQGVGKTEMIKAVAKELNINVEMPPFAAMEPSDLIGLMQIQGENSVYKKPKWFPTEGKGILFIDEVNRVNRDVLATFYNLILERRIGDFKLGDDWIIVAACNPSEGDGENYDVFELDAALMGRFRIYGVKSDVQGFLNYFESKYGCESLIYQYVIADPEVVSFAGKRGTPRDFEYLEKTSQMIDFEKTDTNELRGIVSADIGMELAASFVSFMNLRSFCTPKMILYGAWEACQDGLEKAKERGRFDIETALMRAIADGYTKGEKASIENVLKFGEFLGAEKGLTMLQLMLNKVQSGNDVKMRNRFNKLVDMAVEKKSKLAVWCKELNESQRKGK